MNKNQKILFSNNHSELITLENKTKLHILLESTYSLTTVETLSNYDVLNGYQVLVIGAPTKDLETNEASAIKKFVEIGGGLLLISDSKTILNTLTEFEQLIDSLLGFEILEFLNASPEILESLSPHYITANVKKIKVENVAYLLPHSTSQHTVYPIAKDTEMQRAIIACGECKQGRIVIAADVEMFTESLHQEDNEILVNNIFSWLCRKNPIDIIEFVLPPTIKWKQSDVATLKLYNPSLHERLKVKCTLESDKDAINEISYKERSILPQQSTLMQWDICPKIHGNQELRLSIETIGENTLYFDKLPEVKYLLPESFKLETKNNQGILQTAFETGEEFLVYGSFDDVRNSKQLLSQLHLDVGKGLRRLAQKVGEQAVEWKIKAVKDGAQELKLEVTETGQLLSSFVSVTTAEVDQRHEIEITYVQPLDAEIKARLIQVNNLFREVGTLEFKVLSPEEYITEVYTENSAKWLKQLLNSAIEEDMPEPSYELLRLFMLYIVPCYLPSKKTAFIPHAPTLAKNLGKIYPTNKDFIKYNLLCSDESEDFEVRQHIAAYLLHEKYGHGFFYTQTRLGQQLVLLERHKPKQKRTDDDKAYHKAVKLLNDSAIIINEGFAAWLEITFLGKLDKEIRQVVELRRIFLLEQSNGFLGRKNNSDFFKDFSPVVDSIYLEGFKYFNFIGSKLTAQCATYALLLAADIDLGIGENEHRKLTVNFQQVEDIGEKLLSIVKEKLFAEVISWRSHERLRWIVDMLNDQVQYSEIISKVESKNCPKDCHSEGCVLQYLCNFT